MVGPTESSIPSSVVRMVSNVTPAVSRSLTVVLPEMTYLEGPRILNSGSVSTERVPLTTFWARNRTPRTTP